MIDATGLLNGNDVNALSNAIARQQGSITQLQSALGELTVASGSCSSVDVCPSVPLGDYLLSNGITLSQVIAVAIPGNPITPSGTPLAIVYIPGNPI